MSGVVGAPVLPSQGGAEVTKVGSSRCVLESTATEGDSPVGERARPFRGAFPSKASAVEAGLNSGGPPSKAKYYLATDSEPVA